MGKKIYNSDNSTIRISNATIIGDSNVIIGNNNTIDGDNNIITGNNCRVDGDGNSITGNNARVDGDGNRITGNNIRVDGDGNIITGNNVKVDGDGNRVTGNNANMDGDGNTHTTPNYGRAYLDDFTSGDYSHPEGYRTSAMYDAGSSKPKPPPPPASRRIGVSKPKSVVESEWDYSESHGFERKIERKLFDDVTSKITRARLSGLGGVVSTDSKLERAKALSKILGDKRQPKKPVKPARKYGLDSINITEEVYQEVLEFMKDFEITYLCG